VIKSEVDKFQEICDELCDEAIELTGDEDPSGYTFDFIYNTRDAADDFIQKMGIKVVETPEVDVVKDWLDSKQHGEIDRAEFVYSDKHKPEMERYLNLFLSYARAKGLR
jgi:hypothetical protein